MARGASDCSKLSQGRSQPWLLLANLGQGHIGRESGRFVSQRSDIDHTARLPNLRGCRDTASTFHPDS
jgi:hypothetical protein